MAEKKRELDAHALLEQMRGLRADERAPEQWRERLVSRLIDEARALPCLPRAGCASGSVAKWPRAFRARAIRSIAWVVPVAALLAVALLAVGRSWKGSSQSSNEVELVREPPAPVQSSEAASAEAPSVSSLPAAASVPADWPPSEPETSLRRANPIQVPFLTIDATAVSGRPGAAAVAGGPNLVSNGDFSQGDTLWAVRDWTDFQLAPARAVPHQISGGALCLTIRAGEHSAAEWPSRATGTRVSSFELIAGRRYRLSLRAWASGAVPTQLVARVGHQMDRRDQIIVARIPVSGVQQLFSVDFRPKESDADLGVGWIASAGAGEGETRVCVDDVSLVEQRREPEHRNVAPPSHAPAPPSHTPAPPPKPLVDCRQPYWTDPDGNRRLKVNCL